MMDDGPEHAGEPDGIDDLDLGRYDLTSVARDLTEIANLPRDFVSGAFWAVLVPIVAVILTALVFSGSMSGWGLALFAIVAGVVAIPLAVVAAIGLVVRRKVKAVSRATGEVLDVVADMHGDLLELRSGAANLTVRSTASALAGGVVFPMLAEVGTGAASVFLPGPFKALAGPIVSAPISVVERAVTGAIDHLEIDVLGEALDLVRGDGVPVAAGELRGRYDHIQSQVEGVVRGIVGRSSTPYVIAVVVAAVPILVWWLLGWWLG